MSQLNAFMGGLNEARQQSERDTRLAMDIEGRRAALAQTVAQDARASERLQLDRDRAIRDARDSDFNFQQKQEGAARDTKLREEMGAWSAKWLAPRKEVGPDGQERTLPPLQSTFDGQAGMYSEWAAIRARHGLMKPEELRQFSEFRKEAERNGLIGAVMKARTGDMTGMREVLGRYGVSPQNVEMKTVVDPQTKLATTKLIGTGVDGKPFDFDFTPVFASMGLDMDPDKPANDRAVLGSRIGKENAIGQGALMRGQADMIEAGARAKALREGGGGRGPGFDRGLEALNDNLSKTKYTVPDGWSADTAKEDTARKEWVRRFALDAYRGGRVSDPFDAQDLAETRFKQLGERALAAAPGWVRERGQLRPAGPADKNPLTFDQLRGREKLTARDLAIDLYDRQQKARDEERRRQAAQR